MRYVELTLASSNIHALSIADGEKIWVEVSELKSLSTAVPVTSNAKCWFYTNQGVILIKESPEEIIQKSGWFRRVFNFAFPNWYKRLVKRI